ncbi:MAG: SDR family NAD(P)-dependent oxidoreductase [Planctomycetes bacterium]|nr:SDR family NAD(P)-dependent oxidoreductase [Planctomycetota bacterium]
MEIADNVFLVTGAASGLGAACASQLAAAGGKVVLADTNRRLGEELAGRLGPQARFAEMDVRSADQVRLAIHLAVTEFGGLHGAICCAGIAHAQRVLGRQGPHDIDRFAEVIHINLIGTFNCIRLAAEAISAGQPNAFGERGVIVPTASIAAFDGQIGQAAYAASKGGIVSMTLPLARELAQFGIRVVTIAPGVFDTPLMQALPTEARESLEKQTPFPPRLGQPVEFAALVRHVIENPMLNGEVIRLDGALRMGPK